MEVNHQLSWLKSQACCGDKWWRVGHRSRLRGKLSKVQVIRPQIWSLLWRDFRFGRIMLPRKNSAGAQNLSKDPEEWTQSSRPRNKCFDAAYSYSDDKDAVLLEVSPSFARKWKKTIQNRRKLRTAQSNFRKVMAGNLVCRQIEWTRQVSFWYQNLEIAFRLSCIIHISLQ